MPHKCPHGLDCHCVSRWAGLTSPCDPSAFPPAMATCCWLVLWAGTTMHVGDPCGLCGHVSTSSAQSSLSSRWSHAIVATMAKISCASRPTGCKIQRSCVPQTEDRCLCRGLQECLVYWTALSGMLVWICCYSPMASGVQSCISKWSVTSKYSLPMRSKKSALMACQGRNGMSFCSCGSYIWLYASSWQIEHWATYCSIFCTMPFQYTEHLALRQHLLRPWYPACSIPRMCSCINVGISTCWLPWGSRCPQPTTRCRIWPTWLQQLRHLLVRVRPSTDDQVMKRSEGRITYSFLTQDLNATLSELYLVYSDI